MDHQDPDANWTMGGMIFSLSFTVFAALLFWVSWQTPLSVTSILVASTMTAAAYTASCVFIAARHNRKLDAFKSKVRQLTALADNFPGGVVIFDGDARLAAVNPQYSAMYGLAGDGIRIGMSETELQALRRAHGLPLPSDAYAIKKDAADGTGHYSVEFWKLRDGRTVRVSRLPLSDGGWIATHEDVSKEVEQQQALEQAEGFLSNVIDNVPSAILVKDVHSLRYTIANRAAQAIHNVSTRDLIGRNAYDLFPAEQARRIESRDKRAILDASTGARTAPLEDRLNVGDSGQRTIVSRRHVVRDARGEPTHLLTVIDDITEQKQAEEKITHLAMHDPLTGLFNRSWINENFDRIVANLDDNNELVLGLLDLHGFKDINETFGHAAGDGILCSVASRTQILLGEDDRLVRLAGDEFAILAIRPTDEDAVKSLFEDVLKSIGKFVDFQGQRMAVRASIGFSATRNRFATLSTMLREADMALNEAREAGKGVVCRFDPAMIAKRTKRQKMEMDLRRAIAGDQFELFYQPIVDAQNGRIKSMEALLRWNHPERGMVPPNDFIPLTEETGLIVPIGEIVLEKACAAAAAWPEDIRVSVNISPVQFRDLQLGDKIARILARTGLKPQRLELEITEATLLNDDSTSLRILNDLRATGVRIVMDDFGTGYSSLNYIRSFPFDKIKIDKSYVDGLIAGGDRSDRILHAVITLAKDLKIDTTAEGVEMAEQIDILQQEGCTELQGYFFSKPVPATELEALFGSRAKEWRMVA